MRLGAVPPRPTVPVIDPGSLETWPVQSDWSSNRRRSERCAVRNAPLRARRSALVAECRRYRSGKAVVRVWARDLHHQRNSTCRGSSHVHQTTEFAGLEPFLPIAPVALCFVHPSLRVPWPPSDAGAPGTPCMPPATCALPITHRDSPTVRQAARDYVARWWPCTPPRVSLAKYARRWRPVAGCIPTEAC